MSMRTLVVTAADEAFTPLLRRLICSLLHWQPRPFTDLAFLDLGVSAETRKWVTHWAEHIVEPAWDLPLQAKLRAQQPHLRALTVRPFLPDYFPGYEVYLWIDADAWVQEPFALDRYFSSAFQGPLAAVAHSHRCYQHTRGILNWQAGRDKAYFLESRPGLPQEAYFNAGVFALRGDAPHWQLWAKFFREGIERTNGWLCCDQTALNQALWSACLPVDSLPATCNWLCHLAPPRFDPARNRWCEPIESGDVIGIVHLAGNAKQGIYPQRA